MCHWVGHVGGGSAAAATGAPTSALMGAPKELFVLELQVGLFDHRAGVQKR